MYKKITLSITFFTIVFLFLNQTLLHSGYSISIENEFTINMCRHYEQQFIANAKHLKKLMAADRSPILSTISARFDDIKYYSFKENLNNTVWIALNIGFIDDLINTAITHDSLFLCKPKNHARLLKSLKKRIFKNYANIYQNSLSYY